MHEKTRENFINTPLIFIDVDNLEGKTSEDFINSLDADITPNIWYNTFSSVNGNERMRLVYLMEKNIDNEHVYRYNSHYIVDKLGIEVDNCTFSPFQFYLGTGKEQRVQCVNGTKHKVYDVELKEDNEQERKSANTTYIKKERNIIQCNCTFDNNSDFMRNYWSLDNREFIVKYTDSIEVDNCTFSPFQFYLGTGKEQRVQCVNGTKHKVYDVELKEDNEQERKSANTTYIKKERNIIQCNCTFDNNSDFMRNYWSLDNREFIVKYTDSIEVVNNTPLKYDPAKMYIELPDDYIEIERKTYTVYDMRNGEKTFKYKDNYRWKDGEGRKKKLFLTAIMRRMMLPTITFEQLLFNTVWELENFYLNTKKDYITKKQVFQIVTNALKENLDSYKSMAKRDKRKFIVNPYYNNVEGYSNKQLAAMAKKAIHYAEIGELYDCNLTDKENLKVLEEYGVKCSLRTLKNFRKDNGISKYNKVKK